MREGLPAAVAFAAGCFLALRSGASQTPGYLGALLDSVSLVEIDRRERERRDSIAAELQFATGTVGLGGGLATLRLPAGYRYLDPADADRVLSELWANPPGEVTLGLIVPAGVDVADKDAWAVLLRHDTTGHVRDGKGLSDPDGLMRSYLEVEETRNEDRMGANNPRKDILGWVAPPVYDSSLRILHWGAEARAARHDGERLRHSRSVIEYQVRVMGRRGVIGLEARMDAGRRHDLLAGMAPLLSAVSFNAGFRYSDFDPERDPVSRAGLEDLIIGFPVETAEDILAEAMRWLANAFLALILVATLLARRRRRRTEKGGTA